MKPRPHDIIKLGLYLALVGAAAMTGWLSTGCSQSPSGGHPTGDKPTAAVAPLTSESKPFVISREGKAGSHGARPMTAPELARKFQVKCEDPSHCSPSVGAALIHQNQPKPQTSLCTFYVVGPSEFMMSKHCLANQSVTNGSDCAEIDFLFPEVGSYPASHFTCAHILDVSSSFVPKDNPLTLDYVVMRSSAPHQRPFLKINPHGIPNETRLWVHRVDPVDSTNGIVRVQECSAVMMTSVLAVYTSPFSPLIGMPRCPTRPGNSGSPILDEGGEVRAMINSLFPDENYQKSHHIPADQVSAHATNLACFSSYSLGYKAQNAECEAELSPELNDDVYDRMVGSIEFWAPARDAMEALFAQWTPNPGRDLIRWRLSVDSKPQVQTKGEQLSLRAFAEPECLLKAAEPQEFSVNLFSAKSEMKLDERLRPTVGPVLKKSQVAQVRLSPDGTVQLKTTVSTNLKGRYRLSRCSNQPTLK